MKVPVGVKGITVAVLLPPPQPATVTMISARAKTLAARCLRTNFFCCARAKINSEQTKIKMAKRIHTAREIAGFAATGVRTVSGVGVPPEDGPEPFPPSAFANPASKAARPNLRVDIGGVGGVGRGSVR